ncbi:MAG: ATP-binding protein [Clostridiales bacterium]|nr:ATP-binding protein [Clostridiales bacterium]
MTEDTLLRQFDMLYSSAQSAQSAGQYNKAKSEYYRAAGIMTELAKQSGENLKAARIERAKRIIAIADSLPQSAPRKAAPSRPVGGGANGADDDEGAKFEAAGIPDVTFEDVKGLEAAKEAIRIKMIYPLEHGDVYAALGKKSGGGVLLYGPPGTGKTMLAKAAAHEAGAAFYAVKCSDIVSKWVGESEKNIAALFETARKQDRAIIFFDELDSLFFKRGTDVHNDRRVNELLQQIDGFSSKGSGLMILGATNNPWAVDDAAMRPGRFSQKVYIPLPEPVARRAMLSSKLNKLRTDGSIDIDGLVARTDGFSGADMTELIDRATDFPLRRSLAGGGISSLTMQDMLDALNHVRPSVDAATVRKFEKWERE